MRPKQAINLAPLRQTITRDLVKRRAKQLSSARRLKKTTKKGDEKLFSSRTNAQLGVILKHMKSGEQYKSSELSRVLNLKETRTKELLRILVNLGEIIDDGATKGRLYRRVDT